MVSIKLNTTNKPVEYKTWVIGMDSVTQNNITFLKAYNITVRAMFDQGWFTSHTGHNFSYGKQGQVEFETTTVEQEGALKLLYGDKLLLKMVEVVCPNSMGICELTTV